MKMKLGFAVLSVALALTGCGGDSSSSGATGSTTSNGTTAGGNTGTPSTSTPPATTPPATTKACVAKDNVVYATAAGCNYSIANVNGGAPQTYTCTNGRVSSNGISAKTINLGSITIMCEA